AGAVPPVAAASGVVILAVGVVNSAALLVDRANARDERSSGEHPLFDCPKETLTTSPSDPT
ncbi:hypothetical protein K3495_g14236, partial [Podosphaera aphanis]